MIDSALLFLDRFPARRTCFGSCEGAYEFGISFGSIMQITIHSPENVLEMLVSPKSM